MIGLFLIFWSFALSIAVVWYTLTPLILAITTIAALGGAWFFRDVRIFFPFDEGKSHGKKRIMLQALFLFLAVVSVFLLFQGTSNAALFSPWQGINQWFLPIFFLLTLVLGFLLFSGSGARTMLIFIIIHAFVQHLYLPLSHELPWGGDVWRHIAVEDKLTHGEVQPPGLPEALIIPHKYTYGQLWGVSGALSMVTRLPLTEINRWLMPVLWPIVLPIMLFQFGVLLFGSRRWALALAALPAMSFPFVALGALTLPVSLGFLTFLFVLLSWFRYLETGEKKMKALALTLAALMVFGYALYFVLIWFVIGFSYFIPHIYKKNSYLSFITSLASMAILPVIDTVVGGSRLPTTWNIITALKQFVGQFFGWYYASAIRPHDILSGNIFFNHTPSYAYVENFFTVWRWWVIPVMLALWGIAAIGFSKAPKNRIWQVLRCCSAAVFGWYLVGWYVLEGDRLFTRRLDLTLAFLAIIFFLQGMRYMAHRYHLSAISYQLSAIVAFAFFATAIYASGPDLRVVSREEYDAADVIWQNEQAYAPPYCVLADTWMLLPLEAISAGRIVGGGFPIDRQFGQPDRVRLYEEMKRNPRDEIMVEARIITGVERCMFAASSDT